MKPTQRIFAWIKKNGEPDWHKLDQVKKVFRSFSESEVEIAIREIEPGGTDEQLKYFWSTVAEYAMIAAHACGNYHLDKEGVYGELLKQCAPRIENVGPNGVLFGFKVISLSDMTLQQRSDFIENCCVWLWDFFSVTVPPPSYSAAERMRQKQEFKQSLDYGIDSKGSEAAVHQP